MRLRKTFWILVMLAAPAFVLAQESQQSQQKPPEKPAAEAQKAPEQPAPAPAPTAGAKLRAQFPPAPKLGHPLDPADVDILTGKNKPANAYGPYGYRATVDPYSGFGYPMSGSRFGQSTLDLSGEFSSPRAFSLRNSQAGLPILFFNRGAHRSFVFLGRGLSFF